METKFTVIEISGDQANLKAGEFQFRLPARLLPADARAGMELYLSITPEASSNKKAKEIINEILGN
jgi:hypothetical protein